MKTLPTFDPSRRMVVAGMALLLGGCGALVDRPAPPALYDLGPLPPPGSAPSAAGSSAPPLVLPGLTAAGGLDGGAVLYRLAYDNAQSLRPYAQARWSAPVPQLIHERIAARLARTRAVVAPGQLTAVPAPGGAPLVVRLQLQEFAQHFDAPGQSRAVMRVQATLLRASVGGDQFVAQRSFLVERAAPTPDAAGGVRALAQTVDELGAQLDAWVGTAGAPSGPPAPRAG